MRLSGRLGSDLEGARLRPPPGFAWVPGGLHRRGDSYELGREGRSFVLDAGLNYYVGAGGNNALAGTSYATRHADLWAILNALPFLGTTPVNVWVESGTYDLSHGWSGGNPAGVTVLSPANLIATADLQTASLASWEPGTVRTTTSPLSLTWALQTGGTYRAALAASPYAVVDELQLTSAGLGSRLTLQASIAAVDAAPGSYYWAGGQLYVRTLDSRVPDTRVHAFKASQPNGYANLAANSVYVDGFDFLGGANGAMRIAAGDQMTFNRCSFRYSEYAGLDANASPLVQVFDSAADENGADGFDYTTVTRAVEGRCVGRHNGYDGSNLSNASSMHSGGTILQYGGNYTDSQGINVSHVGGCKVWMAGCSASGTRATDNTRKVNVWIADGGTAYLERCALSGNTTDVRADGVSDTINLFGTTATTGGAGVVRESRG